VVGEEEIIFDYSFLDGIALASALNWLIDDSKDLMEAFKNISGYGYEPFLHWEEIFWLISHHFIFQRFLKEIIFQKNAIYFILVSSMNVSQSLLIQYAEWDQNAGIYEENLSVNLK